MANIKQNMLSRILVRGDVVGTVYLWTSGVQFLYNVFFRLIRKTKWEEYFHFWPYQTTHIFNSF
jgi:hypothetical protein